MISLTFVSPSPIASAFAAPPFAISLGSHLSRALRSTMRIAINLYFRELPTPLAGEYSASRAPEPSRPKPCFTGRTPFIADSLHRHRRLPRSFIVGGTETSSVTAKLQACRVCPGFYHMITKCLIKCAKYTHLLCFLATQVNNSGEVVGETFGRVTIEAMAFGLPEINCNCSLASFSTTFSGSSLSQTWKWKNTLWASVLHPPRLNVLHYLRHGNGRIHCGLQFYIHRD